MAFARSQVCLHPRRGDEALPILKTLNQVDDGKAKTSMAADEDFEAIAPK